MVLFAVKPVPTERTSSCVYNLNYHVVFCPKYRKPVLVTGIETDLKLIFETVCVSNDWKILEMKIMPDHVHIFISSHPKHSPLEVVKKLKGISARLIFKNHPEFKKKEFWGGHLWSEGYYVGSAGVVTGDAIQKYIQAQEPNSPHQ